jgi:hypothetical protein
MEICPPVLSVHLVHLPQIREVVLVFFAILAHTHCNLEGKPATLVLKTFSNRLQVAHHVFLAHQENVHPLEALSAMLAPFFDAMGTIGIGRFRLLRESAQRECHREVQLASRVEIKSVNHSHITTTWLVHSL